MTGVSPIESFGTVTRLPGSTEDFETDTGAGGCLAPLAVCGGASVRAASVRRRWPGRQPGSVARPAGAILGIQASVAP